MKVRTGILEPFQCANRLENFQIHTIHSRYNIIANVNYKLYTFQVKINRFRDQIGAFEIQTGAKKYTTTQMQIEYNKGF